MAYVVKVQIENIDAKKKKQPNKQTNKNPSRNITLYD